MSEYEQTTRNGTRARNAGRYWAVAVAGFTFYALIMLTCIAAVKRVQSPRAIAASQGSTMRAPTFTSISVTTNRTVTATFTWTFPADASAKGVKLWWGTNAGIYTSSLDCGTNTLGVVTNLNSRTRYYFAAQSYSATGAVSPFSNEVSWPMPFTNYVGVSVLLKSNLSDPGRVILQTIVTNPPGDMAFFETKIWQTNDAVTVVRIPGTSTLLITNTNTP